MKAKDQVYPIDSCDISGLTVRDHIAIQAMNGLLAGDTAQECLENSIAVLAYKQADAMIEESNK